MMEAPPAEPDPPPVAEEDVDPEDRVNAPEVQWCQVTRAEWGALPAKGELQPLQLPVKNVLIAYNTGVAPCNSPDECVVRMREIQQLHMDKGLPDIHYNFLIGSDANVYEGRGWNYQPEAFKENPEYDGLSICVGVIGDGSDHDNVKVPHFYMAMYLANHGEDEGHVEQDFFVGEDEQNRFTDAAA